MRAVSEIPVFNTATQIAADYSVEAETEASAVAALAKQLASQAACTITVKHTSYFCGCFSPPVLDPRTG